MLRSTGSNGFPSPGRLVRPDFMERDGREAEVRREAGSLHGNLIAAPANPMTMNTLVNEILR